MKKKMVSIRKMNLSVIKMNMIYMRGSETSLALTDCTIRVVENKAGKGQRSLGIPVTYVILWDSGCDLF